MENIIFLDIDGVLNDNVSVLLFESVEALKQLISTYNARVVMITSWQQNGTENRRKRIRNYLEELGIFNIDFIDPNFEGGLGDINVPERLLGIIDYLKSAHGAKYVILDDDYHNKYKMVCLNYYKINPNKGLSYNDLDKIKFMPVNFNVLDRINYQYRSLGQYEVVTNNLIRVLKKLECQKMD